MNTFETLSKRWELRPIRNCPGRFVVHTSGTRLTPQELLGIDVSVKIFNVASAKDTVIVARLEGGGLISYLRADDTYLHTLNNDEGFERKLRELGIEI